MKAAPAPMNINNILQKRKMGQPLTPQEKRAYLDHVAQQNASAQAQAQARKDQELGAVEKKSGSVCQAELGLYLP